ncbi:hypothetical protein RJ640_011295 [Escallonia rubra]|uniref:EXPERA domain-containing protein n=1 Tax=Escallonia rubra TaxID=112253 RepID=A0AA88RKL8_9ASTE|nr:hypothetical protein RJ640_011295 [Escallonia rubra]
MGALTMLTDAVLFIFFSVIAITAPLFDAQTCLPTALFPAVLLDVKALYASHSGDYLVTEKPHFFVGLVWVELLFQWPLAVASLYAIATGKSWLRTTALLYGVSTFTSMVSHYSQCLTVIPLNEKLRLSILSLCIRNDKIAIIEHKR